MFVFWWPCKKGGKSCQTAGEQIILFLTLVWKLLKQNVAVEQCRICLHFSMCYSYDMFWKKVKCVSVPMETLILHNLMPQNVCHQFVIISYYDIQYSKAEIGFQLTVIPVFYILPPEICFMSKWFAFPVCPSITLHCFWAVSAGCLRIAKAVFLCKLPSSSIPGKAERERKREMWRNVWLMWVLEGL